MEIQKSMELIFQTGISTIMTYLSVEIAHRQLPDRALCGAMLGLICLSLRVLLTANDHLLLLEGELVEVIDLRGQLTLLPLLSFHFTLQVCDVH